MDLNRQKRALARELMRATSRRTTPAGAERRVPSLDAVSEEFYKPSSFPSTGTCSRRSR